MDNLGSHKGKAVRGLIRAAGAKLFFLPRYSPDLNPIEQVFAKLKTLLRKTDPPTIEATWRGIGSLPPARSLRTIGSEPSEPGLPAMCRSGGVVADCCRDCMTLGQIKLLVSAPDHLSLSHTDAWSSRLSRRGTTWSLIAGHSRGGHRTKLSAPRFHQATLRKA
jgi:hypothetical protein